MTYCHFLLTLCHHEDKLNEDTLGRNKFMTADNCNFRHGHYFHDQFLSVSPFSKVSTMDKVTMLTILNGKRQGASIIYWCLGEYINSIIYER